MGSRSTTIGKHYLVAFHNLLGYPADALLEFRVGEKTAWSGKVSVNTRIAVDQPNLFGGESDQGGVSGPLAVMFGDAAQLPSDYLTTTFGDRTVAWRGFTTVAWEGGIYGANNPYPQKPSYKGRWIKNMWEGGCWYPQKAEVTLAGGVNSEIVYLWRNTYSSRDKSDISDITMSRRDVVIPAGATVTVGFPSNATPDDNPRRIFLQDLAGTVLYDSGWLGLVSDQAALNAALTAANKASLIGPIRPLGPDTDSGIMPVATTSTRMRSIIAYLHGTSASLSYKIYQPARDDRQLGMNPAHIFYFLQTQPGRGAESIDNMADLNLRAAADWFHAQGFGLCGTRKAASVSPADYMRHIEQVAACSFTRSVTDGRFYIDIANGEYDLQSLPVLTDDDVLGFKEVPTVLDDAVNSVSVKYFDPAKKLSVSTPPVRALGLIASYGENHQTFDYPEIPTDTLASRVALRELLNFITPTRKFELDTKDTTSDWRRGQYVRVQLAKRGIADMVCIVGQIEHGKLESGGNSLVLVQDVYSLPATSYVQAEHGIDTRPSSAPVAITAQAAFEAPYFKVCTRLSSADLAVLAPDAGYLMAVAANPAQSRDFTLSVADAGNEYTDVGLGDFCPTALVVEAAGLESSAFTLSDAQRLSGVGAGEPVLWGNEICRVDAIDAGALTITLGRGCADTVPQPHAAGERLFFFADDVAYDTTEYTDGEDVSVKLRTNTGSERLPIAAATPMTVEFAARAARPYPPAKLQVGGQWPAPAAATGDVVLTWAQRNRVLQADQLLDWNAPSVTPQSDTRYGIRILTGGGQLIVERSNVAGDTATLRCAAAGAINVQVWAINDNGPSLQRVEFTLDYTPAGGNTESAIDAPTWSPQQTIIDGGEVTA